MYDENEKIKITWTTVNKKYYEDLGYDYTGIGTELDVLAKDLPDNSSKKITAVCDCCGQEIKTPKRNYNSKMYENGKYLCKTCAVTNGTRIFRDEKNKQRLYKKFIDFCKENNYIPLTTIDEYPGIKGDVEFICPIHGK